MTGGVGTRDRTLHLLSLSDVTQWTRDQAPRRPIGCVPRTSDYNHHWAHSLPRREAANRRPTAMQTLPAHGRLWVRPPSANGPPRIDPQASTMPTPAKIRQRGAARRRAIWVRRPPPSFENQRPPAGRDKWFRSRVRSRELSRNAAARVSKIGAVNLPRHNSPYNCGRSGDQPHSGAELPRRLAANDPAP